MLTNLNVAFYLSQVVKMTADNDIYISEKEFKKAKSSCGSASLLTRYLTRCVFTQAAREVCSVSGKQSLVKGQAVPEVRTRLNQEGVDAVVCV